MRHLSRIGFIGWLASMPAIGLCGSWDTITQNINLSNNLTLLQENTSDSIQAGNYINLNDSISDVSQTVTLGTHTVDLIQDHATSSKQALNYLSSPAIGNSQQAISGVTNFSLTQIYGSSNLQAGNLVEGNLDSNGSHTQSVSVDTALFSQANGFLVSFPNIQAGNAAVGAVADVDQTFVADSVTASFTNPLGTSVTPDYGGYNIKAANYVEIINGISP